jgi:hypothetical protein
MPNAFFTNPKPFCTFRLIGIWILSHIPRQRNPVYPRRWFVPRFLWFDPVDPPHHACYANAKTGRHLRYCKPFLFSDSQNFELSYIY